MDRTTRVAASSRTLAMPRTRTHTSVTARGVAHTLAGISQFFGTCIGSSLTTLSRRLASLAALLALSFSLAARADVRELVNAGKVTWSSNATVIYLNADGTPATADAYDHLVLKFTDTTAAGSLTVDDSARANVRVLVVGGGGAGGTSTSTQGGAGGGGGAGGLIETNLTLVGGVYSIAVGAGGEAAASTDVAADGGDGLDSSFDVIVAHGGGGGGAQSVGHDGASGGGGSASYTTAASPQNGGVSTAVAPEVGFAGGRGGAVAYGGGGGGAGAVGQDASSTKSKGGAGLSIDITGESIYYAGGGGGGRTKLSTGIAGGDGGGGRGGSTSVDAVSGTNGLGGGGGGSGTTAPGGNGGSGVVIVRITQLVETKVALPSVGPFTFNKNNQVALDFGIAYTYVDGSGDTNATAVGNYSFKVTPGPDLEWVGGGTGEKTVNWSIVKRTIEKPTTADFTYDGTAKVGVTYGDDFLEYCTFDTSSVTNATNAGTYTFSVSLDDTVNTAWSDNTIEPFDGSWTISPIKVAKPEPRTDLVYDGTEKQGFAALDYARYALTAGVTNATDGGAHSFTFSLLGNDEAENYVWDVDPVTAEPYSGEWTIGAAANAITALSLKGWRVGGTPNEILIAANYGLDTVRYEYGFGETASAVETWTNDVTAIDKAGTWIIRATIDETPSWAAATRTASFDMWDDPARIYHDSVEIYFKARSGATETVTNIPLPVKISTARMPGFDYSLAGQDGSGMLFVDSNGEILPYEAATWNTTGESIVWLKLATLPPTGMTVTMYWNIRPDAEPPVANEPTEVWSDYTGVWHMDEEIPAAQAASARSNDSTAQKNYATPQKGGASSANLNQMVSVDGVIGNGRMNSSVASVQNGNRLQTSKSFSTGSVFTFSGFFKMNARGNYPRLAGTKNNGNSNDGWSIETANGSSTVLLVRGNGSSSFTLSGAVDDMYEGWVYLVFVYNGTTATVYSNGRKIGSGSITAVSNGARALAFGAQGSSPNEWSLNGAYDECRIGPNIPTDDRIKAEYEILSDPDFSTNSVVLRDGLRLNIWLDTPKMDKTTWDVNEAAGTITNTPAVLYGGVTNVIYSVYDPTKTFESTADITETGLYRIHFLATETENVTPVDYLIDLHVIEGKPYTKIGGTNGDSGRVLLMNRDTNTKCPIDYQGYKDNRDTLNTYWTHINAESDPYSETLPFNLQLGTESVLKTKGGERTLWRIVDCRHGNTFPAGVASGNLVANQNYLPYSSTSKSFLSRTSSIKQNLAGQIVMRNIENAAVYSSCFTNGIGTIYFDAVNGWCRSNEDYDNYKIVVEISTNTVEGLVPMDDNSFTIETNYVEEVEIISTNWYGRLDGCWTPVSMIPFKRDGTANFEKGEKTEELALDVENGGTMDNFFRVVVPIDIPGPVRFRIRRTTADPNRFPDVSSFILLDNIIASIPAMSADLVSAGHYDAEKTGTQTLGWELATSVPYPSIGDTTNIVAYAKPEFTLNVGDGSTPDTTKFFSSATMHYRWRYLNQTLSQPVSAWKEIDLNPDDDFKSIRPLELPSRPGDVEYWFEYQLQAPYYKYVDYSGAANASIDYTEERGVLTNRLGDASIASGGSDWYFRIRDGKSDYAGLDIVFRRGSSAAEERVHMALAENHVWRGFVQTKENQTGEIQYRIEAMDEQTTAFAEYAEKTNFWYCTVDNPRFPVSEALVPGGEGSWSKLTLDATTGYVMFQIDDTEKSSMALTVVHADYQNANGWSDALARKDSQGRGPIFVGTSTTNEYKIGVSPSKQTFGEDFANWGSMAATNESWTFPTGLTDIQPSHMYGRTAYEPFVSDQNGLWDVGPGMWVAKKYMISSGADAGVGLQMEGQGKGFFQLIDKDSAPRGVESVEFNARLAQFITFEDFNYYDGDVKTSMTNYTFISRVAYDFKQNKFTGNASLSMIAAYLPNKGCYEARWEWISNPNNQKKGGQRLCLYRWNFTSEGKNATLLTAWTNGVNNANAAFAMAAPNALNEAQTFMPFYITVSNANSRTWVAAGVCMTHQNLRENTFPSGNTWNIVACNDNSTQRLKSGTFGVLATNCEGFFGKPQYSPNVVFTAADELKLADGKAGYYTQKARTAPAGLVLRTQGFGTDDTNWNILPGRMATTNVTEFACGVVAAPVPQTLSIYFGTPGRADWNLKAPDKTVTVNNFGGDRFVVPIYKTENCSIRFGVGGTTSSTRRDIAVDSVVLKPWRGGNWDDPDVWPILPEWADDQHRNKAVGHTNFVFTSAWTTNHTILLSAKRAGFETPSAIRSPLMDGFADDGSHGTGYIRGIGLGMISVAYENAQENAVLALQIATNGVDYTTIGGYDKSFSDKIWTTITNFNFAAMTPAQRKKGILNTYIGLHDVKGAMRLMVPTNTILAVRNITDTSKFGDVTITSITCSDEPPVDVHSWWGWNIRTVGGDQDSEKMMFLDDFSTEAGGSGLSLAINNSVDENYSISRIDVADRESYIQHKPFVQTPTFTSNIVGEVVFKARKYSEADPTATVTLYGSRNATETDEGKWERIDGAVFMVSNAWYETYRAKMDPKYKSFRLAVAGVEGVVEDSDGGGNGLPAGANDPPPRVLLDEMFVSEAVNAIMGFKHVGCFRHDMSGLGVVPNVPSRDEQPICEEAWGVQCEIYGAQLASDIDFTHTPRVKLHWFDGIAPWGYENWKDSPSAHSAWLSRAIETDEDRFVYRSTMRTSPDAVIPMSLAAPSYVQYTLEVVFYTKENPTVPVTNWLNSSDWKIPEWYRPLDLNAQYGGSGDFAAYNILDNIAPGWAWINEVNLFGDFVKWRNTDEDCQFIEIAHPPEADVSGWTVRLLEGQMGNNWVITNDLARFGRDGLSGTKQLPAEDAEVNMVFRVIGSPLSRSSGRLKKSDGTLDGVWKVDNPTLVFTSDGVVSYYDPIVFQLVRTSGIVEHEIIVQGTTRCATGWRRGCPTAKSSWRATISAAPPTRSA